VPLGNEEILGLGRGSGPPAARTAVLAGGAFVTGLIALVSAGAVLTRTIRPGGWITAAIEAALAVGSLYFFVAGRAASREQARA